MSLLTMYMLLFPRSIVCVCVCARFTFIFVLLFLMLSYCQKILHPSIGMRIHTDIINRYSIYLHPCYVYAMHRIWLLLLLLLFYKRLIIRLTHTIQSSLKNDKFNCAHVRKSLHWILRFTSSMISTRWWRTFGCDGMQCLYICHSADMNRDYTDTRSISVQILYMYINGSMSTK